MTESETSMTESVQSVQEGGNTNPPPPKKKKVYSASKRYCFTWNNYTDDTIVQCVQAFEKLRGEVWWIIGKEVADTGTPHLQGYVESDIRWRPSQMGFWWNKAKWFKCKGNRRSNLFYCSKDGDFLHSENVTVPRRLEKVLRSELRQEQLRICDTFKEPSDKYCRKIYWYWEAEGAWGKTQCAKYMVDNMGALMLGGAAKDAFCGLALTLQERDVDTVIFNVPRSSYNRISYTGIESIKDGCLFSPKYESGMLRYNTPHVIVFANAPPRLDGVSADRWVVEHLISPTPTQSGGVEEKSHGCYENGVITL